MNEYSVFGPFKVHQKKKPGGTVLDPDKFWEDIQNHEKNNLRSLATKSGIYVFAIRSGGGITPYYIGKTIKGFEKECFHPLKKDKYYEALAEKIIGSPIMFFIVPSSRAKVKDKEIVHIERFLIQLGEAKNEKLLNVIGRDKKKKPNWAIKGIIRSKGKPSDSAKEFKKMMNI